MVETIRRESIAARAKDRRQSLRLQYKYEFKEAHTVEDRARMQRIWNDPSQATQAKELCAEGAKLHERQ